MLYHKFIDNNADTLWVVFNSAFPYAKCDYFEFFTTFKSFVNCDILFFRDGDINWYLDKISNVHIILEYLITKNKYAKKYAIGCSMGGFGAILFGTSHSFDKIISFSPQINVSLENLNEFEKNNNISDFIPFRNHDNVFYSHTFFDTSNLIKNSKTEIYIYIADEHIYDNYQVKEIKMYENVKINILEEKFINISSKNHGWFIEDQNKDLFKKIIKYHTYHYNKSNNDNIIVNEEIGNI